jgi:hypothetical protein
MLFVDLVKAYDTVKHALLFGILKKYRIPEEFIEVVERMYKDCKVHVQVGKENITIDYPARAQQGDNDVPPVLFLFPVLAISKTTKKDWKYKTPTFGHFKSTSGTGADD